MAAAAACLALLMLAPGGARARRVLATVPYGVRGSVDVLGPGGAKGAAPQVGGQLLVTWQLLDKG